MKLWPEKYSRQEFVLCGVYVCFFLTFIAITENNVVAEVTAKYNQEIIQVTILKDRRIKTERGTFVRRDGIVKRQWFISSKFGGAGGEVIATPQQAELYARFFP